MKKRESLPGLPLIAKLIGIFYFLFGMFYFILGFILSGFLLGFTALMAVSATPFSPGVISHGTQAASFLIKDFFPIFSMFYSSDSILPLGMLVLFVGLTVTLVSVGFWRKKNWARISLVGISLFEIVFVGTIYLLQEGFLGVVAHWTIHSAIILYLVFSKNVGRAFKQSF